MEMEPASRRPDTAAQLAMLCVFFGWFLMSTVVVSLGSLQHGVRFYDLGAVLADPTRLFFGVDSSFKRLAFGCICVACLCGPLWPQFDRRRLAWFGYLAPLVLMMACAALLYLKTSGETFADPAHAEGVAHSVIRFANNMARHGGDFVARHIAVGAGAYLALIGSLVLTVRGLRRQAGQREGH